MSALPSNVCKANARKSFRVFGSHSKIAVAMMVKTPGVSPLKTRLARDVGAAVAEGFYVSSVDALTLTFEMARRLCAAGVDGSREHKVGGVELHPIFAVMELSELRNPRWSQFPTVWQGEGGLGDKLHTVYSSLLERFDGVILVGSDLPHISPHSIASTAYALVQHPEVFCLGPTDDGGFYLFAGARSVAREVWTSVPYSNSHTCASLCEELAPSGPQRMLPSNFDIDEGPDLERLWSNFSTLVEGVPALRSFENELWFRSLAALGSRKEGRVP